MSSFEQMSCVIKDKDTVEDLDYVSTKIQDLVKTFNGLNQAKGFEIMNIGFNAVSGSMECNMLQRHMTH